MKAPATPEGRHARDGVAGAFSASDRPIAGRMTVDAGRGLARCERCAAVLESRELADLLRWTRDHRCAGPDAPVVVTVKGGGQ